MSEQQYTQAEELAAMQSGTVVYGGSRQPRTLFRLHGAGRHWIGEHGERYTDAEADEELGEFESEPSLPTREQIAEAIYTVRAGSKQNWRKAAFRDDYLKEADAVLTLLHEGAGR